MFEENRFCTLSGVKRLLSSQDYIFTFLPPNSHNKSLPSSRIEQDSANTHYSTSRPLPDDAQQQHDKPIQHHDPICILTPSSAQLYHSLVHLVLFDALGGADTMCHALQNLWCSQTLQETHKQTEPTACRRPSFLAHPPRCQSQPCIPVWSLDF